MPDGNIDHTEASQQIGQFAFVGHHFRDSRQGRDLLWSSRRIAPHDNNAGPRIVAGHAANDLPALGISFVGHGTRIDQAQIGHLVSRRVSIADADQALTQVLRLVLIDFAPERDRLELWSRLVSWKHSGRIRFPAVAKMETIQGRS